MGFKDILDSRVEPMRCDECGSLAIFDESRGELACSQCGLVLQNTVLDMSIPLTSSGEIDGYGPPSVGGNASLSTRFTNEARDSSGHAINESTRERMKRLAWLNAHTVRRKDRSLQRLMAMTTDTCRKMDFKDNIRDRTFTLVKQAYEKNVLPNQEFSLLVGGCLLLAAQEAGMYLSVKSLLDILIISRKRPLRQMQMAYKRIKKTLGMHTVRTNPCALIPSAASALNISPSIQAAARAMLGSMNPYHRPEVDVATVLYAAAFRAKAPVSQLAVAKACGTTDISLRLRLKEMYPECLPERTKYRRFKYRDEHDETDE